MKRESEERSELLHLAEHRFACKKRERHDIIVEILEISKNGKRKTSIMERVGLSYALLQKYLGALKEVGYITEESGIWKTTAKGLQVMEACGICHRLMKKVS
jgi:predicted transcriptional regulator